MKSHKLKSSNQLDKSRNQPHKSRGIELPHSKQTSNEKYKTCPICFEQYNDIRKPYFLANCGHGMCLACFYQLDRGICSVCKTEIDRFPIVNFDLLSNNVNYKNEELPDKNDPLLIFNAEKVQKTIDTWKNRKRQREEDEEDARRNVVLVRNFLNNDNDVYEVNLVDNNDIYEVDDNDIYEVDVNDVYEVDDNDDNDVYEILSGFDDRLSSMIKIKNLIPRHFIGLDQLDAAKAKYSSRETKQMFDSMPNLMNFRRGQFQSRAQFLLFQKVFDLYILLPFCFYQLEQAEDLISVEPLYYLLELFRAFFDNFVKNQKANTRDLNRFFNQNNYSDEEKYSAIYQTLIQAPTREGSDDFNMQYFIKNVLLEVTKRFVRLPTIHRIFRDALVSNVEKLTTNRNVTIENVWRQACFALDYLRYFYDRDFITTIREIN